MTLKATPLGMSKVKGVLKYDSICVDIHNGEVRFIRKEGIVAILKVPSQTLEPGDAISITNLKGKIEVT